MESFKYLGSILTHDCRCTSDIKTRIALAKKSFTDMSNTLTNNKRESDTKKRIMKCYIWSTRTYGCESWTLSKQDESRLEAIEGRVDGCRSRGRQRQDFLHGLTMAAGMKTVEMLRLAQDRNSFKSMVTSVRL